MAANPPARDVEMMRLCLRLARRGAGRTSPNPMVGAAVARGGRVLATGWHRRAGAPHAEITALAALAGRARGATLYVNLEPCAHQGRTPPCVDAIVAAGIARVVVGMIDPNPRVRGRGIRKLRARGVRVDVGVLREECRALNEAFVCAMTRGRPLVTLKSAITLDGRIATRTGDARWITSLPARREAHRLRAMHDAILVGAKTVLHDDPSLDVRHVRGRQPVRVVLDGRLRIPPDARLLRDGGAPVWIATTASCNRKRAARLAASGAEVLRLPGRGGRVAIAALLRALRARGILSLLVEGGGETHASFVEARLVDRVVAFVAPILLGGRDAVPMVGGLGPARISDALRLSPAIVRHVGVDFIVDARLRKGLTP